MAKNEPVQMDAKERKALIDAVGLIKAYCKEIGCIECIFSDSDYDCTFEKHSGLPFDWEDVSMKMEVLKENPLEDDLEQVFNGTESDNPDTVNHPPHYETGKFECIEVMREVFGDYAVMDFCLCNAFKYLYRCKRKNGVEDVKKAEWYCRKYAELRREA